MYGTRGHMGNCCTIAPSQFIFKPKNAVKNKGFKKAKKKNTDTISLHQKE